MIGWWCVVPWINLLCPLLSCPHTGFGESFSVVLCEQVSKSSLASLARTTLVNDLPFRSAVTVLSFVDLCLRSAFGPLSLVAILSHSYVFVQLIKQLICATNDELTDT